VKAKEYFEYVSPGNEEIIRTLKATKDGDLAYKYVYEDPREGYEYIAGKHPDELSRELDLQFSQELQLKMAREYKLRFGHADAAGLLVEQQAQDGKLSLPAWGALLQKDDAQTYRLVWTTTDTRPEVLSLINSNEKLALLYRARTDNDAREEFLRRHAEFQGIIPEAFVERKRKDEEQM
jgi:hypothetical protein